MSIRRAKRLDRLPPFLYTEMRRRVAEAKARGLDVIDLGVGDPDGQTPRHIVEALATAAADPRNQKYGNTRGIAEFREAVASWYRDRFRVNVDPATEVLALIGSKEGNHHLAMGLLGPGDVALVPDPAYPAYAASVNLAGADVETMPLLAENDNLPDFTLIPDDVLARSQVMWLSYPNNPTTAVADLEFYARAVDVALRHDLVIVSDNPYSEIGFDGYRAPSILEVEGAFEVAIEFNSLSKPFNMTGWRVGMAVGNAAVIEAMAEVKSNTDSGVFAAIQHAAIAALEGPGSQLDDVKARYQRRRDLTVAALRRAGLPVSPPLATFYVWVPLPDERDSLDVVARIIDETGVVVTPGIGYGRHGEGHLRISLAVPDEALVEALARLELALPVILSAARTAPGLP